MGDNWYSRQYKQKYLPHLIEEELLSEEVGEEIKIINGNNNLLEEIGKEGVPVEDVILGIQEVLEKQKQHGEVQVLPQKQIVKKRWGFIILKYSLIFLSSLLFYWLVF